jgi:hypothetical protein
MLALPPSTAILSQERRFKEVVRRYEGMEFSAEGKSDLYFVLTKSRLTVKEFAISNEGVLTVFIKEKQPQTEAVTLLGRHLQYFGYDYFVIHTGKCAILSYNRGKCEKLFEFIVFPEIHRVRPMLSALDIVNVEPLGIPARFFGYADPGIHPVFEARYQRRVGKSMEDMAAMLERMTQYYTTSMQEQKK